jgi:hypothetical protein
MVALGRRSYNVRSDRIIPNVLPNIILIDNDIRRAHYLAFSMGLKSMSTKQEKVTWDVDEFAPIKDTTSAAVSSTTATTIPVTNPTYYLPNELWQNQRTDEVIQIKEVNVGTGNLTVVRAVTALNSSGGSAAATMASGDQLNRISALMSENSSRQITRTTTPTEVFNYAQQQRTDLSLSMRQQKREMVNNNELPYLSEKAMKEFRMTLNRTYLFGERARFTDENGDDVTATGGIRPFITTNVFDVGGTLFKSSLDEFLVNYGLRFGSTRKILFSSSQVILAFTQMYDSITRHDVEIKGALGARIGTTVLHYTAPNGSDLAIVEDRNITEQRPGEAYGVDMTELVRRPFTNNGISGDLQLLRGTQDKDDLGMVDTLVADDCITYGYEKAHFTLKNVQGGSFSVPIV